MALFEVFPVRVPTAFLLHARLRAVSGLRTPFRPSRSRTLYLRRLHHAVRTACCFLSWLRVTTDLNRRTPTNTSTFTTASTVT